MPIYTDPYDGGTGGGTTTSVCQISPSDNIAVLSNYGNRIADIERFLSRLVAADVHANNLSELADNMGNLINGSVMMPYSPNDSWTGTGGSIAVPSDFTGSFHSGNVTTIWNNGVVTFEVTPSSGASIGSISSWLVCEVGDTALIGGGSTGRVDMHALYHHGGALGTPDENGFITFYESGFYWVSVNIEAGIRTSAGSAIMQARIETAGFVDVKTVEDLYGQHAVPNSGNQTFRASFGIEAQAGYLFSVWMALGSGGTGPQNIDKSAISIVKLSSI